MGGVNFSIHPLFFLFGVYYALTGRIFVFLIYTITAVVHELGHSFAAARRGYALKSIVLMPFGAVISGDDELSVKDQTVIALAGPLLNVCIGLLFVAFWWIFPETYALTDVAAEANFAIAAVNLLPVFPLDGGRVLYSLLSVRVSQKTAKKICKAVGAVFALVLFALFIVSLFYVFNLSFLFFSLFILFGTFTGKEKNGYVRLFTGLDPAKFRRGVPYKKQAIDGEAKLKDLIRILDADAVNEVVVFSDGKEKSLFSQEKILKIVESGDLNAPIKNYI